MPLGHLGGLFSTSLKSCICQYGSVRRVFLEVKGLYSAQVRSFILHKSLSKLDDDILGVPLSCNPKEHNGD